MDTLKVGLKHTETWEVTEPRTTQRGPYRVFATWAMTHFVESTANNLLRPHLKPDQGQVGVGITVRHMGPTPIGKTVRAQAELIAIDRRRVSFKVKVFDDTEQVGESEHERFIVDLDKYFARLEEKLGKK
ncbi:MAG: thioesterase [Betaproteobacteria bacterium]|nr:thioesterase [Betaproteobacteria bacterium]